MSQLSDLVAIIEDPATSDADACRASDALAAAVEGVMRSPGDLAGKVEALQIAEARGWDALLPEFLGLLAC